MSPWARQQSELNLQLFQVCLNVIVLKLVSKFEEAECHALSNWDYLLL